MEPWKRSENVIDLGNQIVGQLALDEIGDTLATWMAHYVAEKVQAAEHATSDDRDHRSNVCAEAILTLWRHRNELPSGKRPFEEIEPIARALQSLDPDDTTPRYFRQARSLAPLQEEAAETARWLEIAAGLDYTARILIRYCLVAAAGAAIDKSRRWVELAHAASLANGIDIQIVHLIEETGQTFDPLGRE